MNTKAISMIGALAAVVALGFFFFASGGYGKVSPSAYQCATALYSACMAQDTARLDRVETMVIAGGITRARDGRDGKTATESGQQSMSEREKDWLLGIVNQARGGDWKSAAALARRMMEDQVSY